MSRVSSYLRDFAFALLAGVALATLWVNLAPASYYDAVEWRLSGLSLPGLVAADRRVLTPQTLISEGFMALFLFFVAKELWEAIRLERGALAGRRAGLASGAVLGGWIGAVALWLLAGALLETAVEATPGIGWPLPLGSDVVLGYAIGRRVFGAGHPGLHLLLLILIANDIGGLLLSGVLHTAPGLSAEWLLLTLLSVLGAWMFFGRLANPARTEREHRRAFALWPYVLAGAFSWLGVVLAGLPGALGLIPLIPAIPHADRAFGLFAEAEAFLHDPLNRLAHALVQPLRGVLFAFGVTMGGIDLSALAPTTGTVLAALWIGKPIGVLAGAAVAARVFGFALPSGVRWRDLLAIALISGMGFTVPVLALDEVLPGGGMAEAARLGLAISLLAGGLAVLMGRSVRQG